ncbi:carboxypeptidase-like regulatory domain-containing protein [Bacteroidota bacterium]
MKSLLPTLLYILLLLTLQANLYGQSDRCIISGYVLDRDTQEPLIGVNVFVSGTLWGTSTDDNGYFQIKNIVAGSNVVVASMVGYEARSRNLQLEKGEEFKLYFNLLPTVYNFDEVNVVGKRPREWYEYLKYFKMFFLGQSEYAWGCTISNEFLINLAIRNRRLIATCSKPVSVVNRGLGFRVDCVLRDFYYDFSNNSLSYVFQPKFVELINRNKEEFDDWVENRERAHLGSLHHFLVSLVKGTYKEDGYFMWLTDKPEENKSPEETISADSILTKSRNDEKYTLKFDKYLQVKYIHKETVSWLKLIPQIVVLDEFAYPDVVVPFNINGDWGRLGVADMLPKYYFDLQ